MEFEITHGPAYAVLEVTMDRGDWLGAETGAMVSRSDAVTVDSTTGGGGITGTLKKAVSDERSMVENHFESTADGGELVLAPDDPGDVVRLDLSRTGPVLVQEGSLLAWTDGVEKATTTNEAGGFLSTGEITVLELTGDGTAFLGATGAVDERDVTSGDPLVADEDHIVAWTGGMDVSTQKDGSIKSSMLGGEGFVTHFRGEGHVWLQSRDPTFFEYADVN